jgi:uncharacterized delta-60 repeat protein
VRIGRSLVMAVLVVVGGVVCAAPAAAAPVGLDASYGSGGLVQLAPPLPSGLFPVTYPLIEAAFAPNGSAYATQAVSTCESSYSARPCQHGIRLFRYRENGALDSAFGGSGSIALRNRSELIAADASGRALVATRTETGGKIERLLPNGRPDRSFGRGGLVVLKGFKGLIGFLAPAGRGRILLGATERLSEAPETPAQRLRLFRLLPNGRLDRSFAKDGRGSYALALPYLETRIVIGRRGSILILGSCCGGFRPVYRISPKGRLDTGFDASARGALQRLDAFPQVEPTALVPRPDGGVDVLGATGGLYLNPKAAQGFELRLRADGSLDRQFGEGGALSLPLPIAAASPGVGGGTIAVAQVEETVTVLRLLADGAPDPAFGGGSGIQMPQPGFGIEAQPLAGARVGLFGNGFRLCSQPTCVNAPYLARFVEASPSRPASKKGGRS